MTGPVHASIPLARVMKKTLRKRARYLEHEAQAALFQWAAMESRAHPALALLFAIPNGGKRNIREAVRLKREGVKAGVPDVCLPVPRCGYVGLWIEMKAGDNKPSDSQKQWHADLRKHGHRVEVCYDWQLARDLIMSYLLEQLDVRVAA